MHFSKIAAVSTAFSVAHAAAGMSKRALSGEATFYGGNVAGGACSFSTYTLPAGIYGTALSDSNWDNSGECGACVSVTGPAGNSITAMIVDECPGCGTNHLDLFPDAFSALADQSEGIIDVTWEYVDCPISSALSVHNKEGVSAYWFSMQVVNANQAVQSLEVSTDGGSTWSATTRKDYNFFENSSGFGTTSVDVKVTSDNGDIVTINDVTVSPGVSQTAASNFGTSGSGADDTVASSSSSIEPVAEPTTALASSSEAPVSQTVTSSAIPTVEPVAETTPTVEAVVQPTAVEAAVTTPAVPVYSAIPTSSQAPDGLAVFHEESASATSTPEPIPAAISTTSTVEALTAAASTSTIVYEASLPAVTVTAEATTSTSVVTTTVTVYTCTAEASSVTLSSISSTAAVTTLASAALSPSSTVATGTSESSMTYSNATTMAMSPSGTSPVFTGAGSRLESSVVFGAIVGLVVLFA